MKYGIVRCLPDKDEESVMTPLQIFLSVMNFDALVSDVPVKEHSLQQNGIVFHNNKRRNESVSGSQLISNDLQRVASSHKLLVNAS